MQISQANCWLSRYFFKCIFIVDVFAQTLTVISYKHHMRFYGIQQQVYGANHIYVVKKAKSIKVFLKRYFEKYLCRTNLTIFHLGLNEHIKQLKLKKNNRYEMIQMAIQSVLCACICFLNDVHWSLHLTHNSRWNEHWGRTTWCKKGFTLMCINWLY